MGLNDKLTHKEAMSIFAGLALGAVIGGATCIHRSQEANNSNPQTIEQTVTNDQNNSNINNTVNAFDQTFSNRPFRYGNRLHLYNGYDQDRDMFRFMVNNHMTYMSWNQIGALSRGNITYISLSTYQGYYPSSNVNMTSRPPAMYRYWNSVNMAAGYRNNVNDASYIKNNENRLGNKVKTWFREHRKNK